MSVQQERLLLIMAQAVMAAVLSQAAQLVRAVQGQAASLL